MADVPLTAEKGSWLDGPNPDDMSDALANVEWALGQMLSAVDEGRYRFEPVHVRADLLYLRGEVRRAKRQRTTPIPSAEGDTHD